MALNSSGPISLAGTTAGQSIEIENGGNGTTQISLNDAAVRTLAGVASGAITMPTDFYGKSNRAVLSYTFSANTANASLNVTSIGGYIVGKSDITITVNSGIYLYSTSTANAGLTLTGGSSGDTITIVNNGYIMGKGGNGNQGYANGNAGGTALSLGFNTTVNNTNASAYIGGGGGSGASTSSGPGGGGAGGGNGGTSQNGGTITGGSGGSIGNIGSSGNYLNYWVPVCGMPPVNVYASSGAGGGRIFSGTGGNGSAMPPTGGGAGGARSSVTWTGGNSGSVDLVEDGNEITGLNVFGQYVCVHKETAIYLGFLTGTSAIFQFDRREKWNNFTVD